MANPPPLTYMHDIFDLACQIVDPKHLRNNRLFFRTAVGADSDHDLAVRPWFNSFEQAMFEQR